MRSSRKPQEPGFTLIELLVVVAIMMILIGMIMGAVSIVKQQQRKVLAAKHVHDIVSSCEAYFMMMHQYPADTGSVEMSGATTNFTTDDVAEADAIYMYLGRKVYESASDSKYGNFLIIHNSFLRTIGGKQIMVDPWGSPYRLDCMHVTATAGAAVAAGQKDYVAQEMDIQKVGEPYANKTVCSDCTQTIPVEKRTYPAKAWSVGPDKLEGADPYSHVEVPTDPWDQDNITSWK